MRDAFEKLFNPRKIAFIGASSNPGKWGFMILHHLVMGGYEGEVCPVNPRGGTLFDRKVYKSVAEIPGEIDLAIFTVEAGLVPDLVSECVKKGVKASVVISAGFKELGTEAEKKMEEEMVRRARAGGMIVVGPNGQGIVNTSVKLYPWMPALFPPKGRIAIVSQSGNVSTFIVEEGLRFNMGVSKVVSSGNQADLKMEDYIEYFGEDEDTDCIICYIEGIEDGRRFLDKVSKVTRKKPVVAIKAGKTAEGAKAARSHTGAIASADEIVSAGLKQAGVIRAETVEDCWAMAATALSQPLPRGRRIGVLTGGGGLGVLAADACALHGLEMAVLSEDTLDKLKELMPPWWVPGNPVDMVAGLKFGSREKVLEVLLDCEEIDGLFLIGVGWANKMLRAYEKSPWERNYRLNDAMKFMLIRDIQNMAQLAQIIRSGNKPIYPITNLAREAVTMNYESLLELLKHGVYPYQNEELAAMVYAKMYEYANYLRDGRGSEKGEKENNK